MRCMRELITTMLGVLVLVGATADPLPAGDAILGIWKTCDDQGKVNSSVEIFKVKDKFLAKIVSLTEPTWPANDPQGMAGKPKNDRYNPDPNLRTRPVIGMQIMHDFNYHPGKEIWENGRIYDPACGKTYKCKLTLTAPNRLEVRGYVGISLLGRTEIWTR